MNKDHIRIIFVFAAAYFISSCDKHKWDDTKNMFKPHGHVDSDHDNAHQDWALVSKL